MTIHYIDNPAKLEAFCKQIKNEPWLTLDTEFVRERTYFPIFCLLQIATEGIVACIDPLALDRLDPLLEIIYDPDVVKVFHSARQDLEIFYHLTGRVPAPIFDTQLAAPLLGYQENPGYGMLVSSLLNINLTKAHTRTDWCARPLSEDQLQYAADDVIHLVRIYQIIRAKLEELGRADWLEDDFSGLTDPELYRSPPENAWLKIKGKNRLTPKQLPVAKTLAEWREMTAKAENRPRNWLLKDELILDLARLQPEKPEELLGIRGINERSAKRYGRTICELITKAREHPPIKLDDKGRAPKKTPGHEAILDLMAAVIRFRADQNSINPSILATRKEMERLLFEHPDCSLLHGWRASMVGRELKSMLEGNIAVSVSDMGLRLERK
ncbi:MAG: ribonuclease D [Gammaproteobacteria bacterium]